MAIEQQLQEIQNKISQAKSSKARAEVELENAQEARSKALQTLKEYGVSTTSEAKDKLIELEAEFEAKLAEAEKALEKAIS